METETVSVKPLQTHFRETGDDPGSRLMSFASSPDSVIEMCTI
jgi:hypothetical protein